MAKNDKNKDIEKLNFEQSIDQLTEIVSRIEQGQISLEDSLQQYERGMKLIRHCRDILAKAEKRIEKISEADLDEGEGKNSDTAVDE